MKPLLLLLSISLVFNACHFRHIKGNGIIGKATKNIHNASRIKLAGNFDVEISQGNETAVTIQSDENILPYIVVEEKAGFLVLKTKDYLSYTSTEGIKVFITTPKLEELVLAGSGNVIGKTKFNGAEQVRLKIAGSGDIKLEVNTPAVQTEIAGSGSVLITGETKDETVKIAGVGNYKAEGLKSENAKITIAGSGDVKVFASAKLDVNIAGSGTVYYRGSPEIKQKVAGSGDIKKIE